MKIILISMFLWIYVIIMSTDDIVCISFWFIKYFTIYCRSKGQLISECPHEKSVSSKIPTKIFLEFWPEIFCSFLGASWKLFGLPGDLVSNTINKEYWKPKKPPGSPKKLQKISGQKSRNIFVGILDETDFSWGHFEINWPLAVRSMHGKSARLFYHACDITDNKQKE